MSGDEIMCSEMDRGGGDKSGKSYGRVLPVNET